MSGFRAVLPLDSISAPQDLSLSLRAKTRGELVECPLGELRLLPGTGAEPTRVAWPEEGGPRVAICMATYDPPLDLFDAQVRSIEAQLHKNWICIVSDDHSPIETYVKICERLKADKRFYVFRNSEKLGFYSNFERCLNRIPPDADFVALCDQDDRWYPNKLDSLLRAFDQNTQLVYSDARVVAPNGDVRSETLWLGRSNNFTDLPALLVANTITGAASLFRAALVGDILPFPMRIGRAFHDHWIGLTALTKGDVRYIDKPLYDYVQHSANIIGHNEVLPKAPGLLFAAWQLASVARYPQRFTWFVRENLGRASDTYELLTQKFYLARCLLIRIPDASRRKRASLERFARLEKSLLAAVQQRLLAFMFRRPTLNYEALLLHCAVVMRVRNAAFRYVRRRLVLRQQNERQQAPLSQAQLPNMTLFDEPQPATAQIAGVRRVQQALDVGKVPWIHHAIAPLKLDVSARYPRRINVLMATIDFKYVYGGYIGMFNLALRLKRAGYTIRIVLVDRTDFDVPKWRKLIQSYPGVTDLFDEVEVIYRYDRSVAVEVSPDDDFIATNCWTAHIAHQAVRAVGKQRFIFMVQEYEPYFVPNDTIHALFEQAYEFPHFGLFSTSILLDFFRERRMGVFADGNDENHFAVFENAIARFSPSRQQFMRQKKRILFYARIEDHAARNLFELGMLSLVALVQEQGFDASSWTVHGIGSQFGQRVELAPGVTMEILPKTSLKEYVELLPRFDVGLSLMLTPHPSLVPLEMASAGMWTVTNTFANKTAERLKAISTNLIPVKPTIEAVSDGLRSAISRVDDIDSRLAGAAVHWPTDWISAFPPETMEKLSAFLEGP